MPSATTRSLKLCARAMVDATMAWSLVFLYAASDELHQVFVPNRTGMVSDVAVDVSGAAIGLTLLWISGKIFKRW